jgi:hypothetical protein
MAISRNTTLDFGLDTIGSYTVGSGTNRLLVAILFGDVTDKGPTFSYNSVNATSIVPGGVSAASDRLLYFFFLLNPASGSHTCALSWSGGAPDHYRLMVADYAGVAQSGQPDVSGSATNVGAAVSVNLTVVTANSWIVAGQRDNGSSATWTNATELLGAGGLHLADSNAGVAAGAITITADSGGVDQAMIAAAFAPAGAVVITAAALQIAPVGFV